MSKLDDYKSWLAEKPAIKEKILSALEGHHITAAEVRVSNFLGQLEHELKEAMVAEVTAPPAPPETT